MLTQTGLSLAPCRVCSVTPEATLVIVEGKEVKAVNALPYRYHAAVDDTLLCAYSDDACYVIGVIDGRGAVELSSQGDLQIRAPHGRIELVTQQFDVRAKGISMHAGRFEVLARHLTERCVRAVRWVRDVCRLKAGRLRYQVDGELALRAQRVTARAEEDARIDGEKIMLG